MPTITFQVTATTTVGRTKTISGANLTRLVAAYRSLLDPNNQLTDDQVVLAWIDGLIAGTIANVRSVENQNASNAAVSAQSDITLS